MIRMERSVQFVQRGESAALGGLEGVKRGLTAHGACALVHETS